MKINITTNIWGSDYFLLINHFLTCFSGNLAIFGNTKERLPTVTLVAPNLLLADEEAFNANFLA